MAVNHRVLKPFEQSLIKFITEDAGLSTPGTITNIRKALFCEQVLTMNDLCSLTLYELKSIKGMGEKSCDELLRALLRNKIECRLVSDALRLKTYSEM